MIVVREFPRLAAFSLLLLAAASTQAKERPSDSTESPRPFFVAVHVATTHPTDTDRRVADFLDTANLHFAPAGIALVEYQRNTLPASFAVLETQGERHKLKKYFVPNTINVFLLDKIDDPTPSDATKKAAAWQDLQLSGLLAGAHIEHKGFVPGTYIILSRNTKKLTLTHELGHFFGSGHSKDPANIMSYGREKLRFDDKQLACFRAAAARFRRQRVLKSQRLD
jgi:hypothetical protein